MRKNQKVDGQKQENRNEKNIITGLVIALISMLLLVIGLIAAIFYWAMMEAEAQGALLEKNALNEQVHDQKRGSARADEGMETLTRRSGFFLKPAQGGNYLFVNEREGYELTIPEALMEEVHLEELCSSFGNEKVTLEIYMEHCESADDMESYIYYSDTFLENGRDHTPELREVIEVAGYTAHLTKWSRPLLKSIDGDKPYYVCLDVMPGENRVCTLLFRFAEPPGDNFLSIAETIRFSEAFQSATSSAILGFDGTKQEASGWGKNGIRDYWTEETKAVYLRYFSQDSPLTWGIFEPSAPNDFKPLDELEEELKFEFDFLVCYKHFHRDGLSDNYIEAMQNAKKENRILELTLQTTSQDEGNMVYDILNGDFDQYLEDFAGVIRDTGQPVIFRLCNEMNGDWCDYSAFHTSRDTAVFRSLYRYVFDKFEEAGALPYTIWVWNPNERSFPEYDWNHAFRYYPGDEYVDIIGLTGYNTGTYYEGEAWRSFQEIYEPVYQEAVLNFNKPIMITEFASSSVGGNKAAWIQEMFEVIQNYDKIKVAIWWNGRDLDAKGNVARPYWLDETKETLRMFKDHVKTGN